MLDGGRDQAFGLRRLFPRRSLRVLAVASDGAQPSANAFVVNLAAALARMAWRPIVIDGQHDGVAATLGVTPRLELADLMSGRRAFASVALRSPEGYSVLPAARGLLDVVDDPDAAEAMFSAIAAIVDGYDIAVLHAPAPVLGALLAHRPAETAILCGPGDEDLTAAYANVKALVNGHGLSRFRVLFDRAPAAELTRQRHRRLADAARRFLAAAVEFGGAIAPERELETARRARASVFSVAAQGRAARAFERIASAAREWQLPAYDAAGPTIH